MPRRLRAPIRWYGGKGKLVTRLVPFVPQGGQPYCEPFCGAASLFFARPPAPVEVLNDLDRRVIDLFRVLQDPQQFTELRHRLKYTLYSRAEFERAIEIMQDDVISPLLQAWATFVGFNQGFAGVCKTAGDWGRNFKSNRGMAGTASRWLSGCDFLDLWHKRLQRVQIDNRDALEVIRYWDSDNTVFYCDPPYILETRTKGKRRQYEYEQDSEFHTRLVETLLACQGAVVLSGYAHPIYAPLEAAGWKRTDLPAVCHAAGRIRNSKLQGPGTASLHVSRTESIWQNPKAVKMLKRGVPLISVQN